MEKGGQRLGFKPGTFRSAVTQAKRGYVTEFQAEVIGPKKKHEPAKRCQTKDQRPEFQDCFLAIFEHGLDSRSAFSECGKHYLRTGIKRSPWKSALSSFCTAHFKCVLLALASIFVNVDVTKESTSLLNTARAILSVGSLC